MTKEDIDKILNGDVDEVMEACREIKSIQDGDISKLVTGIDHLDTHLITGLNNMMVFIGSRPSMGKTHTAAIIQRNLLNESVNPGRNLSIVHLNWEMQTKSLVLREMKSALGRGMKDILSRPFTEDEKVAITEPIKKLKDKRILKCSKIIKGQDFRYLITEHIARNPDKEVIVLCDHIHVLLDKAEIDSFLSICNDLKMENKNLSFVIFFQLNRSLENNWRGTNDAKFKVNPKNYAPNSSHIYNTDSLMQFADIVMAQVIPQVVDLDEYTIVNRERSKHLAGHFISDSDDNRTARLKGRNRIYYHYLKVRMNDNFEDPRLFCDIIDESLEEMIDREYYTKVENVKSVPKFNEPHRVDMTVKTEPVVFSDLSKSSAKGEGFI